ncbi:hypothetical protein Tsubulata_012257 [Turnera subulata]|uniref:Uncharacterized protein n=1 Tax=Turnera subulata TaxID=218843 RepID=A0A9Q0GD71_9ROSI|nr:hypothetical protein Tsubulata_012257 [Turnera subulata]
MGIFGAADVFVEQRIVTEWPEEMFKKPRLRKNSSTVGPPVVTGADGEDDVPNLYKPVFTKRNTNNRAVPTSTAKPSDYISASTWSGFRQERKASKWNDYITQEEDDLNGGNRSKFADHTDQGTMDDWETTMDDEKVEDDIHPDFK